MLNDIEYEQYKSVVKNAILNTWEHDRLKCIAAAYEQPVMIRTMLFIGYKQQIDSEAVLDLAASAILFYLRNTAEKTIQAELEALHEDSTIPVPTQLQNAIDRLSELTYPYLGEERSPPSEQFKGLNNVP